MNDRFRKIANKISTVAGSAWVFCVAVIIVGIWAASGPAFEFSDTWQLIINTGTTIVTFLMVFLIQNTQNRDAKAMQLKLDELIRATRANKSYIDIEGLSDEELSKLSERFSRLREKEPDPSLEKLHQRLNNAIKSRLSININPFADWQNRDKTKK